MSNEAQEETPEPELVDTHLDRIIDLMSAAENYATVSKLTATSHAFTSRLEELCEAAIEYSRTREICESAITRKDHVDALRDPK